MSSIISKPFNPLQKIVRAIFKGSPNLFTTSDLNRQIEAFDYRLKQLERKVGVITDMEFLFNDEGQFVAQYTYLEYNGCVLYSGGTKTFVIGETSIEHFRALGLVLTETEISYSDDSSHAISGVKFADGTSRPGANHQVISGYSLVIAEYTGVGNEWSWPSGVTNVNAILCELKDPSSNSNNLIVNFVQRKYESVPSFISDGVKKQLDIYDKSHYSGIRGTWTGNVGPDNIGQVQGSVVLTVTSDMAIIDYDLYMYVDGTLSNLTTSAIPMASISSDWDTAAWFRNLFRSGTFRRHTESLNIVKQISGTSSYQYGTTVVALGTYVDGTHTSTPGIVVSVSVPDPSWLTPTKQVRMSGTFVIFNTAKLR